MLNQLTCCLGGQPAAHHTFRTSKLLGAISSNNIEALGQHRGQSSWVWYEERKLSREKDGIRPLRCQSELKQVPISFLFEHQLKASGDAQSVGVCLLGPYRMAVQGLKRGLLVSRDCSFRLRMCPILARKSPFLVL